MSGQEMPRCRCCNQPPALCIGSIVHTSIDDGLSSARNSSDECIRRAIDYEKANLKRSSLITGLLRLLRKRQKESIKRQPL